MGGGGGGAQEAEADHEPEALSDASGVQLPRMFGSGFGRGPTVTPPSPVLSVDC